MLSFEKVSFEYDPYPVGVACPVLDEGVYEEMLDEWPAIDWFRLVRLKNRSTLKKYTLDEDRPKGKQRKFVRSRPIWRDFHAYIKSEEFVRSTFEMLREHAIDLGYAASPPKISQRPMLDRLLRRPAGGLGLLERVDTRLQFSMLPGDGGSVMPHSDAQDRIATIVVQMPGSGEWEDGWGGGLDVNRVKDRTQGFAAVNRSRLWDQVEVVRSIDFRPNQAVIVVKTFNSWHSVRPVQAPGPELMRRSLTISINRKSANPSSLR